ncbi:MAG: DUF6089 family protein [Bacteroidaceae bacterium]|nr:DUF6089 family protein [Bacteroidaceae bacterium]
MTHRQPLSAAGNDARRGSVCAAFFILLLLSLPLRPLAAQETEEYNMEVGAWGGGCFYMGDANVTTPFKSMAEAAGVLARYNLNPRMVVKGGLGYGHLTGTTDGQPNYYPNGESATFDRRIFDFSTHFEYNFFAYGTQGYKDSHRFTPYLLAGAGITFAPKPAEHVVALHIPVGIGVKYKLAHRLNVGAEWTFRFTSTDKLDVSNPQGLQLNDPYHITSTGLKNKDTYSFVVAYISYDIFAKECDCND